MSDEPEEPYEVPAPPSHLKRPGREAWQRFCGALELDEVDHLALLAEACSALDLEVSARRKVRDGGLLFDDPRSGRKYPNPALAIEAKARSQAAQIIGQLRRALLQRDHLELAVEREVRIRTRAASGQQRQSRRGGGVRRVGS
jgi:hypothetical protein